MLLESRKPIWRQRTCPYEAREAAKAEEDGEMLLYTHDMARTLGGCGALNCTDLPAKLPGELPAVAMTKPGRTGGMAGVATCRNSIWHVVKWPVRDCHRFRVYYYGNKVFVSLGTGAGILETSRLEIFWGGWHAMTALSSWGCTAATCEVLWRGWSTRGGRMSSPIASLFEVDGSR
jgi:hypothetical protein